MKTVNQYATIIMLAIHEDMDNPEFRNSKGERMPRDVGTFSELHDYCDANMYLIDYVDEDADLPDCICSEQAEQQLVLDGQSWGWVGGVSPDCKYHDAWDEWMEFANLVTDEVDSRLRAEALRLGTGNKCSCGRLSRFQGGAPGNGHWVHLDDQSHQCDPCYFCFPYGERGPTWKPEDWKVEDE